MAELTHEETGTTCEGLIQVGAVRVGREAELVLRLRLEAPETAATCTLTLRLDPLEARRALGVWQEWIG